MSKTMCFQSNNPGEDIQAATSIIFEIQKGSADKIVWFSNLNHIVDGIQGELKQIAYRIDILDKNIYSLEKTTRDVLDAIFVLRDTVEKLEKKQKAGYQKIVDALIMSEDEDDYTLDEGE